MFNVLTDPQYGNYDPVISKLVISPTRAEFEAALETVLFGAQRPDVFTLYFAGHGEIVSDVFYLCLKDTSLARLSLSGFGAPAVFQALSERQPPQANLIVDACRAGGLGFDISILTKAAFTGGGDRPSITLFAAAAADAAAYEDDTHGRATREILNCLSGAAITQTTRPYLDLIEVGRHVSQVLDERSQSQGSVVWGLNLHGTATFSLNPAYNRAALVPGDATLAVPAISPVQRDDVYQAYLSLPRKPDVLGFIKLIDAITLEHGNAPGFMSLIQGIKVSFVERAAQANDAYIVPQLLSALAVCLFRSNTATSLAPLRDELFTEILSSIRLSLTKTMQAMSADKFALLSDPGGLSDLLILPLRLSHVMGWAGLMVLLAEFTRQDQAESKEAFATVSAQIVERYGASLVSVSDAQAPGWFIYFTAAKLCGDIERAEQVFGQLFESFVNKKGNVLQVDATGAQACSYLVEISSGQAPSDLQALARPSVLGAVLMWAASEFTLEGTVNPFLSLLDHHSVNIFLPAHLSDFGAEKIEEGVNVSLSIGHDIWKCEEFRERFAAALDAAIAADDTALDTVITMQGLISSLMLPDRVCWTVQRALERMTA